MDGISPIGLKYEIVPLTKPFGLYTGNIFQGVVLKDGKPQANVKVEKLNFIMSLI